MLGSLFLDAGGADKHMAARDTCCLFKLIIFLNGLIFTFFSISLIIYPYCIFYESISLPQIGRKKLTV